MDDPRLYMRTAAEIEQWIREGKVDHGARLNIGLIATELGVSRVTVGHALRVLSDRGLVRFWVGLGWFVA